MYCRHCGAEVGDHAKFCASCGQSLTNEVVASTSKPVKKKSGKGYMVLTALVLVVTIVIVSVFDLWPWSIGVGRKTDEPVNEVSQEKNDDRDERSDEEDEDELLASNEGEVLAEPVAGENAFSLDAIVAECPECEAALETYIQIITESQKWAPDKDVLKALSSQLYTQAQHFCTAQTMHVENVPYSYKGSFGLYTGDWVGAGPSGKGCYCGTVGGNTITYEGDWGYGLPNGEGVLYEENYMGAWDRTYTGQMKDGMRNGTGSWFEYYDSEYHDAHYRIYDTTVYTNDMITDWVDCVDYDASTGEIKQYCKMKTDEAGNPLQGTIWGPDEMSPELKNAMGVAGALFVAGATIYITGSLAGEAIDSIIDPNAADAIYDMGLWEQGPTPEWTQQEIERKRTAEEEYLKQVEEQENSIRDDNDRYCEQLKSQGLENTWDYKHAAAYSNYH